MVYNWRGRASNWGGRDYKCQFMIFTYLYLSLDFLLFTGGVENPITGLSCTEVTTGAASAFLASKDTWFCTGCRSFTSFLPALKVSAFWSHDNITCATFTLQQTNFRSVKNLCVYVFFRVFYSHGTTLTVQKFECLAVQKFKRQNQGQTFGCHGWKFDQCNVNTNASKILYCKFDRCGVKTIAILIFVWQRHGCMLMCDNSSGRCHFGFAKIVLCACADCKTSDNS